MSLFETCNSAAMNLMWILLLIYLVNAHIVFDVPSLSCDPILPAFQGCMRGQICSLHGICENVKSSDDPQTSLLEDEPVSTPVIGPLRQRELPSVAKPEPDESGNLPETNNLPDSAEGGRVIPPPSSNGAVPRTKGNVTTDGTCGVKYGDTVCGNWHQGSCCSPYGWCGDSTSHCGFGCQSGPCLGDSAIEPLKPMDSRPPRIPGVFDVVGESGVPVMIAVLLQNGKVLFVDKVENYTQIVLENGQFAYSAEYELDTNKVVGLSIKTNPFCCGGAFLADGRVISVGGNGPLEHVDQTVGDGFKGIRYLERKLDDSSNDGASWEEPGHLLSSPRWYPTVQILPDRRLFVVSGSVNGMDPTLPSNNNPTYEILDRNGYSDGKNITMSILERNQPYYMYPFLHLLKDGTVFVFVARSAEIFDVGAGETVKTLPDLRGDYRTYPNTGGSVLLPLSSKDLWEPDIMVCGGGAYQDRTSPTDGSCGRIRPLSEEPEWELDPMPTGRGMVEGIILPDGTVLWLNGCNKGAQGFGLATDPVFDAWIYDPEEPLGERWKSAGTTSIPRLYHSVALLLLDGTVMVAGSNPNEQPVLVANPNNVMEEYATEFRVEIYTPHYLLGKNASRRPQDVYISSKSLKANGGYFSISFKVRKRARELRVALYHGGFVTHSLHMNHRMLFLDTHGWNPGKHHQKIWVTTPPDSKVAPPGPYVVYVVVDGVPSVGQFVMVK